MNIITRNSVIALFSFLALGLNVFATNTENAETTNSFETTSKAAFVNASVSDVAPADLAPAASSIAPVAATSLVFFLDKAEYYTVTIMDEFNQVVISKEINGKKGLNSFLLDFQIGAKDHYTFSVYGENGVDFSGNIPHA